MRRPKCIQVPITRLAARNKKDIVNTLSYDIVSVADLSSEAYTRLRNLNHRSEGIMQSDFIAARRLCKTHPSFRSKAICAIAHSPEYGIVGWGMLFNDSELRILRSRNNPRTIEFVKIINPISWGSYFYVKKAYRGRGIGSQLISRLTLIRKHFHTYKYTETSRIFFKKNGK